METNSKRLILKLNTEFLILFSVCGIITFSFAGSPFLNGLISGAIFGGTNFYLLIVAISMFLYPGSRKIPVYGVVILKSLILYGGLAFLLIKMKLNPLGFLTGFGTYTFLIILTSLFSLRRLNNARA
jgi:hypothetical protein